MVSSFERRDRWHAIHALRARLAEDLADLPAAAWTTPSLCEGLSVREVLAHLTVSGSLGPFRWFAGVVRARFDFDAQVRSRLAEQLGADPAETLDRFRATVGSRTSPPLSTFALLGEIVIHGADIRRPLGLADAAGPEVLAPLLHHLRRTNEVVPAGSRVRGLRLVATDAAFDEGAGPAVHGPLLALVMATTGRRAFAEDLSGEGAGILLERAG